MKEPKMFLPRTPAGATASWGTAGQPVRFDELPEELLVPSGRANPTPKAAPASPEVVVWASPRRATFVGEIASWPAPKAQ